MYRLPIFVRVHPHPRLGSDSGIAVGVVVQAARRRITTDNNGLNGQVRARCARVIVFSFKRRNRESEIANRKLHIRVHLHLLLGAGSGDAVGAGEMTTDNIGLNGQTVGRRPFNPHLSVVIIQPSLAIVALSWIANREHRALRFSKLHPNLPRRIRESDGRASLR